MPTNERIVVVGSITRVHWLALLWDIWMSILLGDKMVADHELFAAIRGHFISGVIKYSDSFCVAYTRCVWHYGIYLIIHERRAPVTWRYAAFPCIRATKFIFQLGSLNPHGINERLLFVESFIKFIHFHSHTAMVPPIAKLQTSLYKLHVTHNPLIRSKRQHLPFTLR